MKNEDNIRVNMGRMRGYYIPFIEVDFMDKDAKEHTGLMIVDSGTNDNLLFGEMADLCMVTKVGDEVNPISTISGDTIESTQVQFSFVLGSHQIREDFCLCNDSHIWNQCGMTIIGIIGTTFLCRHNLVIDYNEGTLHTSDVNPENLSISDCDYFFPMEIGLKCYRLPVVAIKQNDAEVVMMADTGATNNSIAKQSLKDKGFSHSYLDSKDVMNSLVGIVEVDQATVDFNLLTLDAKGDVAEVSHHDHFMVMPHHIIPSEETGCDENGEQIPPVEGLISSDFMAKQRWVLDFGAKIIYKRKVA